MRRIAVFSAAVLLAITVSSCSDDDTNGAEEAFTFAEDDLCVWVSADEVADFVAAEFKWDGTAEVEQEAVADPDGCDWTLTSTVGTVGEVHAGNAATTWKDFDGNPYDFEALDVVDFDEDVGVPIGASVSGHPSLSDGVVVHNGGFCQFAFWVPPGDEYLSVTVGPGDMPLDGETEVASRSFAVADRFLDELGWLG